MQVRALEWGVKQSFRNYVAMSGGTTEAGEGAEQAADGAFVFPAAAGEGLALDAGGAPSGRAAFDGEVRFEAHGGMLSVRVTGLEVEIGPQGGALSVDDHGRRTVVAKLDLSAAQKDEDGGLTIPAALAMDGIQWLGDHYPMLTPLDPVRLRVG